MTKIIHYCNKCIMPSTRPDVEIDNQGICNACRAFEFRKNIDWTVLNIVVPNLANLSQFSSKVAKFRLIFPICYSFLSSLTPNIFR